MRIASFRLTVQKPFGPLAILYVVLAVAATGLSAQTASARTLDIYFIDVEGGQSTLIVLPNKETLLVDAGYASDGRGQSEPGDPIEARDPQRIVEVAKLAGVSRSITCWSPTIIQTTLAACPNWRS